MRDLLGLDGIDADSEKLKATFVLCWRQVAAASGVLRCQMVTTAVMIFRVTSRRRLNGRASALKWP